MQVPTLISINCIRTQKESAKTHWIPNFPITLIKIPRYPSNNNTKMSVKEKKKEMKEVILCYLFLRKIHWLWRLGLRIEELIEAMRVELVPSRGDGGWGHASSNKNQELIFFFFFSFNLTLSLNLGSLSLFSRFYIFFLSFAIWREEGEGCTDHYIIKKLIS